MNPYNSRTPVAESKADSNTYNYHGGIGFGAVLAAILSYVRWHSVLLAFLHATLGWCYVIYSLVRYGWPNIQ
jgi:hypothetical protein